MLEMFDVHHIRTVSDMYRVISESPDSLIVNPINNRTYCLLDDQVFPLDGKRIKELLTSEILRLTERLPAEREVKQVLEALRHDAIQHGCERRVYQRLALDADADEIAIDLGGRSKKSVLIRPGGWDVEDWHSVLFEPVPGALPLPKPDPTGTYQDLIEYLGVSDQHALRVITAFLIASFCPHSGSMLLEINGPQGSGKSYLAKSIRQLLDPSRHALSTMPASERDLGIDANHHAVLVYDNQSGMNAKMCDHCCRLLDGWPMRTRELYTDDDQRLLGQARPMIITGITPSINRNDLLDRSFVIELPRLPERSRESERELNRLQMALLPKALGCLFNGVAAALGGDGRTKLPWTPRRSDAGKFVYRAGSGLGIPGKELLEEWRFNAERAMLSPWFVSPLNHPLQHFLTKCKGYFKGTATELLAGLHMSGLDRRASPRTPSHLSGELGRLQPCLAQIGIHYKTGHDGIQRYIELKRREAA